MRIFHSFFKKKMPYAYPLDWPKMPYLANTGFFCVTMVNYSNYQCRCWANSTFIGNQPDSQRNHQRYLNVGCVYACMNGRCYLQSFGGFPFMTCIGESGMSVLLLVEEEERQQQRGGVGAGFRV
jgi:hypothetical protein